MEEKIINELNAFLDNSNSSTIAILNKAVLLAEIASEVGYQLLFESHLNGLSKTEADELYKTNYEVYKSFFSDREKSGETVSLLGSILSLESSINHFQTDIDNTLIELQKLNEVQSLSPLSAHGLQLSSKRASLGILRTNKVKIEEIIGRIRNRVASFVRQREKIVLKKSTERENRESKDMQAQIDSKKVFIVHGHDNEAKETVSNFLHRLKLEPIILHEQANKSKLPVIE